MADISYGSTFGFSSGSPATTVSGLISLSVGGVEINQIKMSALDQGSLYHVFRNGMIDGGQITVKMNYLKTIPTLLATASVATTPYYFKVTLPDTSTWTGTCNLKSYKPFDLPEDDRDTIEFTIQLTGAPTWTPV